MTSDLEDNPVSRRGADGPAGRRGGDAATIGDPMSNPSPGRSLRGTVEPALVALLLLSGFCGISYEILYSRWLGNLLGSQFVVNASVLLTFLLGIGLGTLWAHRLARWLWAIEAGIGAYAILMAVSYEAIDQLLYNRLPMLGTSAFACAVASIALLAIPAFLIGCSLPIFAGLLKTTRVLQVFPLAYGVYNVGAALTALAMEFVLLRAVGLSRAAWILATLNGLVALGVVGLSVAGRVRPFVSSVRLRFPNRVVAALVTASVASAVFQLLMIKVAEFIFGPYNETFALVLATVLIGLTTGSYLVARFGLTFDGAIRLALGFGATIPALLRRHEDVARESGQLLFYSSVANAGGFFVMAFVLHRLLDYGAILCLVSALAFLALLIHGAASRAGKVGAAGLLGAAVAASIWIWDEPLLYVGHTNFHASWKLERERGRRVFAERFKGPQDVFAIVWKEETPYFFINGYISIPLDSTPEKLVGALSAVLAPRTDRALVLGVGSGNTAGTVGLLFDEVDAVEINKVVLDNLELMAEYNFDLPKMANVELVHDDGIHFVKTSDVEYSLILNTVTTPLYFSSSKLYTEDFFEIVARRLAPNGVYVTWVDSRIGDVGVDIILETLAQTFDDCWLSFMSGEYYLLACAREEIVPGGLGAVAGNRTLAVYLAEEHELPARLIPHHVISTTALELRPTGAVPVNRLDYPILEFEMARLSDNDLAGFSQRLEAAIDLREVRRRLQPIMDWLPSDFAVYKDLRLSRDLRLTELLHGAVVEQFPLELDYEEAALRLAGEIGSGRAFYRYGKRLLGRDLAAGAATAFEEALALDAGVSDVRYYLARALFDAGRWESALSRFTEQWELDQNPRVPLAAARTLVELDRTSEALDWLGRADPAGEDAAEVAHYRGFALERTGEVAAAVMSYREALSIDPSHELALDALRRLRR